MTLIEKFNEVAELANVAPIPEVFGLSGREQELALKEAEAFFAQETRKDDIAASIDWGEFDKQDQIIFSSND